MAKPNPNKVNPYFAEEAIKRATDKKSVYSECVRLSFQSTGRLSCGFDAKDILAWIDINMPNAFDAKGKKIQ